MTVVESVTETPICCELKQQLDTLYEMYTKSLTREENLNKLSDIYKNNKTTGKVIFDEGVL